MIYVGVNKDSRKRPRNVKHRTMQHTLRRAPSGLLRKPFTSPPGQS